MAESHTAISLLGKVALVTGGAGAIGSSIVGGLLDAGASVAAIDASAARLQQAEAAHQAVGRRFLTLEADVGSWPRVEASVARVAEVFGHVDIVVNNAALFRESSMPPGYQEKSLPLWDIVPDGFEQMMRVNAVGQFYVARAAIKQMMARKWGRIVNISTSFDSMFAAGGSAYGQAKAAVEVNTVVWAKELAGSGVTVNVLIPGGPVDRTVPVAPEPRIGEMSPEVMVPPLLWLVSDHAKDVSGARVVADEWNTAAAPDELQTQAISPAGWPGLAAEAADRRKVRIKERGRAPWPGH